MASLGIENLENPRKKNKRENLGEHGHSPHPGNVHGRTAVQPLSGFPDNVLAKIFSFLPIKQAIQASTVSPRFKQSWLVSQKQCAEETVENWLQTSIAKGVEELDLNFSLANVLYKISSGFDDVKTMKILKLCRCDLELLPTFQGLTNLLTPTLTKIKIAADSIKTVFSNCMFLETLKLVQCREIDHLEISLENLRSFKALKVGDCSDLRKIEIESPTLCSFYYSRDMILFKSRVKFQLHDLILDCKPLRRRFFQKRVERFFKKGGYLHEFWHVRVLSTSSTLLEICDSMHSDSRICGYIPEVL
ncbi:Uncharacterized protein TCM_029989 [Theobroma cacao]|uniref:F-box domain-containing protein n=1 Tax=Theobroma cacao TaxID=3641 RepID=A0A061GG67_THECC|nr:Uncharacterized protein TCM_029989 [Theobroma cacao]